MATINGPALLCALSVSLYWLTVFVKAMRITPKIGKTPNVIPREALGFLSRLIMLPLIIVWICLPWQATFSIMPPFHGIAWVGAIACIMALMLTAYCWHYMGTSWRIGIDPKEKNNLITDGPFKLIRHPIYSLSMLLMLGSFVAVQTQAMFIIFCVHWILFTLEAYKEERYLCKVHGSAYKEYIQKTNRFLPPFRRASNA